MVNNSDNQGITGDGSIPGGGKLTGNGTIENSINIDLPVAPTITGQPQAKTVSAGETAEFTVTASGNPAPAYQWQVSKGSQWENIPSATNSSYTTEAAAMSMNGWQYRCVATNNKGTAESNATTLTVQKAVPPRHFSASEHRQPSGENLCLVDFALDAPYSFSIYGYYCALFPVTAQPVVQIF